MILVMILFAERQIDMWITYCSQVLYRPGIPNLVYQCSARVSSVSLHITAFCAGRYSIYVNYESDRLNELNPEIDQENWQAGGL